MPAPRMLPPRKTSPLTPAPWSRAALRYKGTLTLPAGQGQKLAAVVVIHSAGGFEDPTRAPYVAALNKAGIATLELNLFAAGGRPKTSLMNLPHTYGALLHLAQRPDIDPSRIGVTGFSHGGFLAMFSASAGIDAALHRRQTGCRARADLSGVLGTPGAIEGKNPVSEQNTLPQLTDAPVHVSWRARGCLRRSRYLASNSSRRCRKRRAHRWG